MSQLLLGTELLFVRDPSRRSILPIKPCESAAAEVERAFLASRVLGEQEGEANRLYFQRQVLLRRDHANADELLTRVECRIGAPPEGRQLEDLIQQRNVVAKANVFGRKGAR